MGEPQKINVDGHIKGLIFFRLGTTGLSMIAEFAPSRRKLEQFFPKSAVGPGKRIGDQYHLIKRKTYHILY